MGLTNSRPLQYLSAAEMQAHQTATGLSLEQLEQLHMRFLALDRSQRGYLTPTELLRIPQLAQNPLHRQIIDGFFGETDCKEGERDRINFNQFVRTCATFLVPPAAGISAEGRRAKKLRLLCKMFDSQRCGHIERNDFRKILMSLLDGAPPSEGVANVNAHSSMKELEMLEELAFGTRQSISYEHFVRRLSSADIDSKLAVHKWLEEDQDPN